MRRFVIPMCAAIGCASASELALDSDDRLVGSVDGTTLEAASLAVKPGSPAAVMVVFASYGIRACDRTERPPEFWELALSTSADVPDEYVIAGGSAGFAVATLTTQADCDSVGAIVDADAGHVTLEAVGEEVVGSFEVSFGADVVSGSFSALPCDAETGDACPRAFRARPETRGAPGVR